MTKRWMIAAMMSVICAHGVSAAARMPPKIRVDRAHHGFVDAAGKPFVPFGVSYEACTASGDAMEKFRQSYLAAFVAGWKAR